MDEERPSGSDAILGDFLTQVIYAEQSSDEHNLQTSADKSRQRDALIANSLSYAHMWLDDCSVTVYTNYTVCGTKKPICNGIDVQKIYE